MRTIFTLAALLAAGTAAAGPMDGERWDAGVVEGRGHEVLTTGLTFTRTGPGEWAVSARCQVTDTRTKRWRTQTGRGVAVRSMGLVLVDVPGLGRFAIFEASDEIAANVPGCASGAAIFGTGD